MCLTVKSSAPRQVAQEDIVTYKVAFRYKHENQFRAPYRDSYKYTLDTVMEAKLDTVHYDDYDERFVVSRGFHSLKSFFDAEKLADDFNNQLSAFKVHGLRQHFEKYYIMKSVIPKGSEYYEGTFNGMVCYASDKLVITAPISLWEKFKEDFFGEQSLFGIIRSKIKGNK